MKVDRQVDPLVDSVADITEELVRLLSLLPFSNASEKDRIRAQIRSLLQDVDEEVRAWADRELQAVADEHEEDLLFLLPGLALLTGKDDLVRSVTEELTSAVSKATKSVSTYASTLSSRMAASRAVRKAIGSKTPVSLNELEKGNREIKTQLKAALDKHFVRVLGRDGKVYQYALDYWVGMQAQMARGMLRREISLAMTLNAGYDLVQISNNPSTVGDFCDLYRGKVFSISGNDPFYPPLSATPNGGTPFHPWCKHVMFPYTAGDEVMELADIPEKYLVLGNSGSASINDFQAMWVKDLDD